jgi:hypothetical protein
MEWLVLVDGSSPLNMSEDRANLLTDDCESDVEIEEMSQKLRDLWWFRVQNNAEEGASSIQFNV